MNLSIIIQCKTELAEGKIAPTINVLLKNTGNNSSLAKVLLVLSCRFNRLRNKELKGTMSSSEAEIERNKIVENIIDLLAETPFHVEKIMPTEKNITNYEKALLYRSRFLEKYNLTRDEVDIISLFAQQIYSHKEIADLLYICEFDFKKRLRSIESKLYLSTNGIINFAYQAGIIIPIMQN